MKFEFGPYAFVASGSVSGYAPKTLDGPNRQMHVIEHQIPAREGGVVEYLGSEQSRYSLKGFVSPSMDGPFNGTAAAVLSGTSYVSVNADDAKGFLVSLRGSGAQLLRIESTSSNQSGYMGLYENGFFFVEKMTWGFEAGRTYPYYPYGIELHGVSIKTFGNSSGTTVWTSISGGYLSGYSVLWLLAATSGSPTGSFPLTAVGIKVNSVASGNLRMGVYNNAGALQTQSAPQAVHSGWNYFPLRPSFTLTSGAAYYFGIMGDATSSSGYSLLGYDTGTGAFTEEFASGQPFNSGFASSIPTLFANTSGFTIDTVLVA